LDHLLRLNARQSLIKSLKLERKPFVIDAHAMQNGRVDIVDMHRIANHVVAEIVSLAKQEATFDSPSSQPETEISRMVTLSNLS
jgi:hypothetical protein